MYVGDRDTYNDAFCADCGRIADRETLDTNGLCEDCRSPLANIVETTEATLLWLEGIIPQLPPGRAEYIMLPTKKFPDRIYDQMIDRLNELKEQGIIGYRQWENSISIVRHQRNNSQTHNDRTLPTGRVHTTGD